MKEKLKHLPDKVEKLIINIQTNWEIREVNAEIWRSAKEIGWAKEYS